MSKPAKNPLVSKGPTEERTVVRHREDVGSVGKFHILKLWRRGSFCKHMAENMAEYLCKNHLSLRDYTVE